jgi:hypothetical protein
MGKMRLNDGGWQYCDGDFECNKGSINKQVKKLEELKEVDEGRGFVQ